MRARNSELVATTESSLRLQAELFSIASKVRELVDARGDPVEPIEQAINALPSEARDRPYVPDAEAALFEAVRANQDNSNRN